MSEISFKIAFVVLWIIYILVRVPFEKKYKQEEKIKTIHSVKEKCLLSLLFLGLLLIPIVWLFTPFLDSFEIALPVWTRILGIVISILSLLYFNWIHKTLGANWSPTLEIRKGHQLIKTRHIEQCFSFRSMRNRKMISTAKPQQLSEANSRILIKTICINE